MSKDRLLFSSNLDGWREAVEHASAPLLANKSITRGYVDAMLDSIAAGGTYIDIGFGIALAHTRPERGALHTCISALWCRPPVLLNDDPTHPVSLMFCLAAADSTAHLGALKDLARLLGDDTSRQALLKATNPDQAAQVLGIGQES